MCIKTNLAVKYYSIQLQNCKKTIFVAPDAIWCNLSFGGTSGAPGREGFFQNNYGLLLYGFSLFTSVLGVLLRHYSSD